jgi:hypothetical protein
VVATIEVADVFRAAASWRAANDQHLSRDQRRVYGAVRACRTAALGGHSERCSSCGYSRIAYNSCRNRHCPKCQGAARRQWLADRQAELLPVAYFHVVFTLPPALAAIALQNKAAVYGALFQAATETLRTIASDPRHLGAEIGGIAVLHTWGQNLQHHPHLHCIVPGGGPSPCGTRWIACRPGFFLPVRVLGAVFRRLFLARLRALHAAGQLNFFGELVPLADAGAFRDHLAPLRQQAWLVYAKPPFGGPEQVLAYLGRYTHRVAITNHRLIALQDGRVSFRWKDYRHHDKLKVMHLDAGEFTRRFLMHTLPGGFHRIRHFGLLANGHRAAKLRQARDLLAVTPTSIADTRTTETMDTEVPAHTVCPDCNGRMVFDALVPATPEPAEIVGLDSS